MLKSIDLLWKSASMRFLHTSSAHCKGHAKWQNIKHIKAENDRMRHAIILKQLRNIRIAANEGGLNPEFNSTLRIAIEEARRRDVPQATIQGYLKKLHDSKDKTSYQRYLFEGRLYNKLYFIVTVFTDRLAYAKIQMATPIKKHLAESTNAKRVFTERGIFNVIARDGINAANLEDECLNDAIECGAEDIEVFDVSKRKVTFFCDPREFMRVGNRLQTAGYKIEFSECIFIPNNLIQLNDTELIDYKKFKERLTSVEGFDEIYDNLENDEEDS